jgi:hypothetical protein
VTITDPTSATTPTIPTPTADPTPTISPNPTTATTTFATPALPCLSQHSPLTPLAARGVRKAPTWLTVVLSTAAGLVLAAGVSGYALSTHGYTLPHTPTPAEAKQACKTAIEDEAQRRFDRANTAGNGTAVGGIAGIDVTEPIRTSTGYTVDGTIRYQVLSILGTLPGSVFVTCTATINKSALSTTVTNR